MNLIPIDVDNLSDTLSVILEGTIPPTTNMPAWLALWWIQEKKRTVVDKDGDEWNSCGEGVRNERKVPELFLLSSPFTLKEKS